MYKKEILRIDAEWDSISGKHFKTVKYLECIFYGKPDAETKPYFCYGALGAVVGGSSSGCDDFLLNFLNNTAKKKQVTVDEIMKKVEIFKKEIEENPDAHFIDTSGY